MESINNEVHYYILYNLNKINFFRKEDDGNYRYISIMKTDIFNRMSERPKFLIFKSKKSTLNVGDSLIEYTNSTPLLLGYKNIFEITPCYIEMEYINGLFTFDLNVMKQRRLLEYLKQIEANNYKVPLNFKKLYDISADNIETYEKETRGYQESFERKLK
jgi:hypothetical protein